MPLRELSESLFPSTESYASAFFITMVIKRNYLVQQLFFECVHLIDKFSLVHTHSHPRLKDSDVNQFVEAVATPTSAGSSVAKIEVTAERGVTMTGHQNGKSRQPLLASPF